MVWCLRCLCFRLALLVCWDYDFVYFGFGVGLLGFGCSLLGLVAVCCFCLWVVVGWLTLCFALLVVVWFGLITYGLNLTFVGVTAWVWWLLPLLSGLRLDFGLSCWRVDLL